MSSRAFSADVVAVEFAALSSASPDAVSSSASTANKSSVASFASRVAVRRSIPNRKVHSSQSMYRAYTSRDRSSTLSTSPSAHFKVPCASGKAFSPPWWHDWNESSGSHACVSNLHDACTVEGATSLLFASFKRTPTRDSGAVVSEA